MSSSTTHQPFDLSLLSGPAPARPNLESRNLITLPPHPTDPLPHLQGKVPYPLPIGPADGYDVLCYFDIAVLFGRSSPEVSDAIDNLTSLPSCLWVLPKADLAIIDLAKGQKRELGRDVGRLSRPLPSVKARPGAYLLEWENLLGDTEDMLADRGGKIGPANSYLVAGTIKGYLAAFPRARVVAHVQDRQLREYLALAIPGGQHRWLAGKAPEEMGFSPRIYRSAVTNAKAAVVAARQASSPSASFASRAAMPKGSPASPATPATPAVAPAAAAGPSTFAATPPRTYATAAGRTPASTTSPAPAATATPKLLNKSYPIAHHPASSRHILFLDTNIVIHPLMEAKELFDFCTSEGFTIIILPKVVAEVQSRQAKVWLRKLEELNGAGSCPKTDWVPDRRVHTSMGTTTPALTDGLIRLQAGDWCRRYRPSTAVLLTGDKAMSLHWDDMRELIDPTTPQTVYHGLFRPGNDAPELMEAPELRVPGGTIKWLQRVLPSRRLPPPVVGG